MPFTPRDRASRPVARFGIFAPKRQILKQYETRVGFKPGKKKEASGFSPDPGYILFVLSGLLNEVGQESKPSGLRAANLWKALVSSLVLKGGSFC